MSVLLLLTYWVGYTNVCCLPSPVRVLRSSLIRPWQITPCLTSPASSTGLSSPSLTPSTTRYVLRFCHLTYLVIFKKNCLWFSQRLKDLQHKSVKALKHPPFLPRRSALPSLWLTSQVNPSCSWARGRPTTTCAAWMPAPWSVPWWRLKWLHVLPLVHRRNKANQHLRRATAVRCSRQPADVTLSSCPLPFCIQRRTLSINRTQLKHALLNWDHLTTSILLGLLWKIPLIIFLSVLNQLHPHDILAGPWLSATSGSTSKDLRKLLGILSVSPSCVWGQVAKGLLDVTCQQLCLREARWPSCLFVFSFSVNTLSLRRWLRGANSSSLSVLWHFITVWT